MDVGAGGFLFRHMQLLTDLLHGVFGRVDSVLSFACGLSWFFVRSLALISWCTCFEGEGSVLLDSVGLCR
jgi:hypothetical protein